MPLPGARAAWPRPARIAARSAVYVRVPDLPL